MKARLLPVLTTLFVALLATNLFAIRGIIIFNTVNTLEEAETEIENLTALLDVSIFLELIGGANEESSTYRLYAEVDSIKEADQLLTRAKDEGIAGVFRSARKEKEEGEVTIELNEDGDMTEYDEDSVNATLAKMDDLVEQAQTLIPNFQPRDSEPPVIQELPVLGSDIEQDEEEADAPESDPESESGE